MNPPATTQAGFYAALTGAPGGAPDGLTTWNGSDPAVRFSVYRNNRIVALLDALADSFPVTQELVGEAFFRAMARLYIEHAPPRSPVLAHYGDSLPAFIEGFAPAASVPYLADVARLEVARQQALHGADCAPLDSAAIAAHLADTAAVPALLLQLHPVAALVASRHAVVAIWAAHQGHGDLSSVDLNCAQTALILRPALQVLVLTLTLGTAAFVAALLGHQRLGDAATQAHAADPAFDASAALALLIGHGAIVGIHVTDGA